MASDPDVRAGISVRRIDVKQIRLFHLSQSLAQFRGAVLCAESAPGEASNPLRLVQAGNFPPRNPQPGCRPAAIAALAVQFFEARQDRGGDFGAQARGGEIVPAQEKILRKILAVRFKRDHAAWASRQLRLQQAGQAIEADRNFRPRGIAARRWLCREGTACPG